MISNQDPLEDYILKEIDRLGEMMLMIARKLGLLDGNMPDYSLTDVKDEFGKAGCPIDLDMLLQQENPVRYLVEKEKLSNYGLETMIDIIFHSDLDEARKMALLSDGLEYLDGKGYFSFSLHYLNKSVDQDVSFRTSSADTNRTSIPESRMSWCSRRRYTKEKRSRR